MKAAYYERYGSAEVLQTGQLPLPHPARNEVLVKVEACSVNPRDIGIRSGELKFITGNKFPKITCADFSGSIVALGKGVKEFKIGDEVYGYIQSVNQGCLAEYIRVPINWISRKSNDIPHQIAAAMPCTYLTALQAVRNKAAIKKGEKILIYGASGGVGTAAIQLAKHYNAHVTAVCNSRNAAYCKQQGADEVWCYDEEDILAKENRFDIFFQVYSKYGLLYNQMKHLLKPNGSYITLIPSPGVFISSLINRIKGNPKLKLLLVKAVPDDLELLQKLAQQGKLRPHISHAFEMDEIKEAHKVVETNHAVGKVVVTIHA